MRNFDSAPPFLLLSFSSGVVALLLVAYIGLIAVVMSYAASTVEFTQSVRNDESTIATLEAGYLAHVAAIANTDFVAAGYTKPDTLVFVRAQGRAAVR